MLKNVIIYTTKTITLHIFCLCGFCGGEVVLGKW
jgi:hypothetical protein